MIISRRGVLLGGASAAGAAAFSFPAPAIAQSKPIKIGFLAALTGASSAPTLAFNRGVLLAVSTINAAGGINGNQIELLTRDTQGDPTKAVNGAQELISQAKVDAIWGPINSGESLATLPIMTRAKMPNLHPCAVDKLIDPLKYPSSFRLAPSNHQWDEAPRFYSLNVLKAKKIAVIGDTTGNGVLTVTNSVAGFENAGAEVVYKTNIDATQPDMMPDLLRARDAGADVVVVWSVTPGMQARILNARAAIDWDVPVVGHPSLASGEIAHLLDKPANWEKVFAVNYKSCCYDVDGKLPVKTQELVARLTAANVPMNDTLLGWIAGGVDAIELFSKAIESSGSTDPEGIIAYLNGLSSYQGYWAKYSFSPTQHNGFPSNEIVMSQANSSKGGTFKIAPGY